MKEIQVKVVGLSVCLLRRLLKNVMIVEMGVREIFVMGGPWTMNSQLAFCGDLLSDLLYLQEY